MDFRIILYSCLIATAVSAYKETQQCLTGYMTDVQSWVDEYGALTSAENLHMAIDLSAIMNPVPILQKQMTILRSDIAVKYLSMARCRLSRVPTVFQFRDSRGRNLAETVEYITFYGNSFLDISSPGEQYDVSMNATNARVRVLGVGYQRQSNAAWSTVFRKTVFPRLKELDLRACSIQILSGHIFEGMQNLKALYLGENEVFFIDTHAFAGLRSLIHLDISRNDAKNDLGASQTFTTETMNIFEPLKNLVSLDLSYTKLVQRQIHLLKSLGPSLARLSLCETGLSALTNDIFNQTSLRILDVSDNSGILSRTNALNGLENTLEVLYANGVALRTMDIFKNFRRLKILGISKNEISAVNPDVAESLTELIILDLDKNRISSWFGPVYAHMPRLELLSLKDNSINIISKEIIRDIRNVSFIALSGNFFVCNCHTRDFFDLALRNEGNKTRTILNPNRFRGPNVVSFHTGFIDFQTRISQREKAFANCTDESLCYDDLHEDAEGNFLLLDFHPSTYMCLHVPESRSIEFSQVVGCNRSFREMDYGIVISNGTNKIYALLTLPIIMVILGVLFVFRRNLRYFLITLRNSALLSVINKNEVLDEGAIFHYDVFVSYCNEDRSWVLDHLLPHLESDCSINACLHERDFQVGYSILENIVSCMDRSRSIMLIISQRFLLSQWCQFEMHLAQHRLLETRREDLTLVLLEEVPRRLRPNTLHYLMLTKTYIVWPKEENERTLFWRRLKKSLITIKLKHTSTEGVSLA